MQLVRDHRSNTSVHLDAIRGLAAMAVFLAMAVHYFSAPASPIW